MMSKRPDRKSIRLPEYDYGQPGNYFFTICTVDRVCSLGEIRGCEVHHSALGQIVNEAWLDIPDHHPMVQLDAMVVMPNHVHGIIGVLSDENGMPLDRAVPAATFTLPPEMQAKRRTAGPGKGTLGAIIGSFKSASARNINKHRETAGAPVWQRNYYEHIIRDERSLDRVRSYITDNPARWDDDDENPYRLRG